MTPEKADNSRLSPATKLTILLCLLLAIMVSVEFLARAMHDRRKATLTVEDGLRNALLIRHSSGSRQLLFAGNSLVFDDLLQPELQQSVGPGFVVHTAGVPGSTYYDWRFGLRALFARGSQPDVLVFSISPSQFLRHPSATPVPVALLWNVSEILDYDREQRLNLTQVSELLLEHYSTYYAMRNTTRIYVRKFIPGYEPMVQGWTLPRRRPRRGRAPRNRGHVFRRLAKLLAECGSHTRLVLMVPPTNQSEDEDRSQT